MKRKKEDCVCLPLKMHEPDESHSSKGRGVWVLDRECGKCRSSVKQFVIYVCDVSGNCLARALSNLIQVYILLMLLQSVYLCQKKWNEKSVCMRAPPATSPFLHNYFCMCARAWAS